MHWLDQLIGYFNPSAGLERVKSRAAIKVIAERKYDGAAKTRRTEGWLTSGSNANAAKDGQIKTLRDRARDLLRNNAYAAKSQLAVTNHVVGRGIKCNVKHDDRGRESQFQDFWNSWSQNPGLCDYEGQLDFDAMTRLVMDSVFSAGEVLIRRRRTESGLGFSLQVLEADHIVTDKSYTEADSGNRIVQGIEIDETGRPVYYHLWKNHPGSLGVEVGSYRTVYDVVRVPAQDIIHVYKKTRPGELRGASWLAPVMINLRELDEFEDAMIVRQKISACFAAFVTDIETPDALLDIGDDEKKIERLEPGIIEYLPPGKDIKFGAPPLPQAEAYKFFVAQHLRAIASGIGITYEALTGDLSEVNFSSARLGRTDMDKNVDSWRRGMLIPMYCRRVFDWFLESMIVNGQDISGLRAAWVPPKSELVDPTKEIPAQIRAVRGGLASLSDIIRQSGKDPDEHFAEIARDNEKLDELGLVFDSDPRLTTAAGMLQVEDTNNDDQNS